MPRPIVLLVLLLCCLCIAGCAESGDQRLVSAHLMEHFRKNGLTGRFRRLNAKSLGAIEGGQLGSREKGFLLEFAKFDDVKKAKYLEARGFRGKDNQVYKVYANGQFVMIVRRKPTHLKKNVAQIFKEF